MKEILEFCKPLQLLYVEDNEEARFFTLEFLGRFFDEVIIAKDGYEGIERFKESIPDLIITDINMPKMGGIDMVKTIHSNDPHVPVIFLSAHNEEEIHENALRSGLCHYLIKPLDISQFIETVKKLIDTGSKQDRDKQ